MHLRKARCYLTGLAILFLAAPIWARPERARTDTAQWDNSQATMVGTTQVKPGDYQLKAQETKGTLDVLSNGKIVAQAPCHWIELSKKAGNTEVVMNKNEVVQVQFRGRTEAVQLE